MAPSYILFLEQDTWKDLKNLTNVTRPIAKDLFWMVTRIFLATRQYFSQTRWCTAWIDLTGDRCLRPRPYENVHKS